MGQGAAQSSRCKAAAAADAGAGSALGRAIAERWALRPCYVCGKRGSCCVHREWYVEVAEIERDEVRARGREEKC